MKIPRNFDGTDFVAVLIRRWGYVQVHQLGSHIILETQQPSPQRLAVPAHKPLKVGTLNGLLRVIAGHKRVTKEDILNSL